MFYVRVDRTRKVPVTVLIRALGFGSDAEIIRAVRRGAEDCGDDPERILLDTYEEGLLELYKKIRPGEPLAVESAESLIMSMFFDPQPL